jgi:hypothetical protein
MKALIGIFCQSLRAFESQANLYLDDDFVELESKYQISMPYVLRGLLIHLLNDTLEEMELVNICGLVTQLLSQFLNIYKEAGLYLERYLTQMSKKNFLQIVRNIQMQITVAFDEDVTDINDSAQEAI